LRSHRIVRLILLALVSAHALAGQDPPYTLKVNVPLVFVDATVVDIAGRPVNDLAAEDFQVFESGVPQQIQYFGPVSAGYDVLLLFDSSGSTQHKWTFMQRAVASFLGSLRPQDRVEIGSFDSDLSLHSRWSDGRDKSIAALPELIRPKAPGGTDLYRAIEVVLRREFRNITGRRVAVVLTDGRDTSLYKQIVMRNRIVGADEDREFHKTLRTVRERRIPVYFIAINTDRNLEPNTAGADEYRNLQLIFPGSRLPQQYLVEVRTRMEQLADASGGKVLFPKRVEEIVPLYEQIGRELGTSYSLGYLPMDTTADGFFRRIEVRVRTEGMRVVQSRAGYYAR
jgi:Ca-activated chloride channel family protein